MDGLTFRESDRGKPEASQKGRFLCWGAVRSCSTRQGGHRLYDGETGR